MQKRSHALLASTLMNWHNGITSPLAALAFRLGSVQPDCNPLSYFKGSLRSRWLRGHNYGNSQTFINRRIARLHGRKRLSLWDYYTLGKLTHYVADAFTFPHNDHYPDSLMDHRRYENNLRLFLLDTLPATTLADCSESDDTAMAIATLHCKYLTHVASTMEQDMTFMLQATQLLMLGCLPPRPAQVLALPSTLPEAA